MTSTATTLLDAALGYAAGGWPVFPLRPGDKKPATSHGFKDATTDPDQIRAWWRENPRYNIAVPTGAASGFIVLDTDNPDAEEYVTLQGDTETRRATTPRGRHRLYQHPGYEVRNTTRLHGVDGLDIRGDGGYIVVAPSVRAAGCYAWENESDLAPLPAWVTRKPEVQRSDQPTAGTDRYATQALEGELGKLARCQNGTRNDTLFKVARRVNEFVQAGRLPESAFQEIARVAALTGLQSQEIDRTIASARSGGTPEQEGRPQRRDGATAPGRDLADDDEPEVIYSADGVEVPPLPELAHLPPEASAGACSWLDDYTDFSCQWSPRAYEGFHEACGLWLLSTVAARRPVLYEGNARYGSVYIALTARTGAFVKSTTAGIATDILKHAGLSYLLMPDDSTPQAFLAQMTRKVPDSFGELKTDTQEFLQQRLAFAAQRGWYFDEFGQKISAMMREGGFMADFRSLLRTWDNHQDTYENSTISRGSDFIHQPALSLLVSLTPADLRPFARKGAPLWSDGFFARFAFVAPPRNEKMCHDFAPEGKRVIPAELLTPLVSWHKRLGVPDVNIVPITDQNGKPTGRYRVDVSTLPTQELTWGPGAREAYQRYDVALRSILETREESDVDGSYIRFPEKAIRIAVLLASIDNCNQVELRHWARAQEITERWRANLHHLIDQMSDASEPTKERIIEDRIITILKRNTKPLTPREVSNSMHNLSSGEARHYLQGMQQAGTVEPVKTKQTTKYQLIESRCRRVDGVDVLTTCDSVYTYENTNNSTISDDSSVGVDVGSDCLQQKASTPSTPTDKTQQDEAEEVSTPVEPASTPSTPAPPTDPPVPEPDAPAIMGSDQEGWCVVEMIEGEPYHGLPDETVFKTEEEARHAAWKAHKRTEEPRE